MGVDAYIVLISAPFVGGLSFQSSEEGDEEEESGRVEGRRRREGGREGRNARRGSGSIGGGR